MNATLRRLVIVRAASRCEYCLISRQFDELPQHIDHIIARKHGGRTTPGNLALACANCSLAKGANIAGKDPKTGRLTRLFHPRTDRWQDHFRIHRAQIAGRSAIGRTTAQVLRFNEPLRVEFRRMLIDDGLFPGPPAEQG